MNKFFSVILFIVVMLSSMACFAQDEVASFDTYIAELNSQCPIAYDDWSIKSLSLSADTVSLELEAPAAISMFLPMLTDDTPGVKRMWFRQMEQYGDRWSRLVDALVNAGCSLNLVVIPLNCDEGAVITFAPSELKKE